MATPYEAIRSKVAQKLEQRNAIRDELHSLPGLLAQRLAAHAGAPANAILIGHMDTDKQFIADQFEEHPQRIVFSIMFDFKLGEDEDFRIPVTVEAAVHGAGYQVKLDGVEVAQLARPLSAADEGNFTALCQALAPKLFANVEEYLLT